MYTYQRRAIERRRQQRLARIGMFAADAFTLAVICGACLWVYVGMPMPWVH